MNDYQGVIPSPQRGAGFEGETRLLHVHQDALHVSPDLPCSRRSDGSSCTSENKRGDYYSAFRGGARGGGGAPRCVIWHADPVISRDAARVPPIGPV